jgi:hypothetical protein
MGEMLGFALRQKKEKKAEVNEKEEKYKMKRNKVGSIFMVSVLALAGIGISYAGFYDEIYVYGTVDTATVEIDWIGWYSGTWVWKIWIIDPVGEPPLPPGPYDYYSIQEEILIYRGFQAHYPGAAAIENWASANGFGAMLVSYAVAKPGQMINPETDEPFDVEMEYDNLFPCIDFCADFIFHYGGSIPAKVNIAEIFPIAALTDLYPGTDIDFLTWLWDYNEAAPGYGAWVEAYRAYAVYDSDGNLVGWTLGDPVDVGVQLHFCDYILVKLCIHLPQDNNLQGLSGVFGGQIGVIQWNDMCDY